MRSGSQVTQLPISIPLLADDLVEFHAARILLLIEVCGSSRRISGLTKLAKLDFFVRYPEFFNRIEQTGSPSIAPAADQGMIRYRYGPWDPRYYQILPFLEARGLVAVERKVKTIVFSLTTAGHEAAVRLLADPINADLVQHMQRVRQELSPQTGSQLKSLVYATFDAEVAQLPLGVGIQQ